MPIRSWVVWVRPFLFNTELIAFIHEFLADELWSIVRPYVGWEPHLVKRIPQGLNYRFCSVFLADRPTKNSNIYQLVLGRSYFHTVQCLHYSYA